MPTKTKKRKRILNKKKGMELSINFIIMLIIAIVVFTFGVKFAYDMMQQAIIWAKYLEPTVESEVKSELAYVRTAVYPASTTISRKENYLYGIGIKNTLSQQDAFFIYVESGGAWKSDKSAISPSDIKKLTVKLWDEKPIIPVNEYKIFRLGVAVPGNAVSGTYVYNIYICVQSNPATITECDPNDADNRYADPMQVKVDVP